MLEMVGNTISRNKGSAQWEMMMEYERVIRQREEETELLHQGTSSLEGYGLLYIRRPQ